MNLSKKKALAAKALNVGKNRVIFNTEGLSEIKEAITKQDIKDLAKEGIISIKPVKGRKKVVKRKTKRGPGKIKKKVKNRKQVYVKITRKLRKYLMDLRDKGAVDRELYWELRKKIRMRAFKSKVNFKEYLRGINIDVGAQLKSDGIKREVKKEKKVKVKKVKKKSESKSAKKSSEKAKKLEDTKEDEEDEE